MLSIMLPVTTNAQWQCPSKLTSYLKPLGETALKWALEIEGSGGYFNQGLIANQFLFGAIEFNPTKKHSFYLEGGSKYWLRSDYDFDPKNDQIRLGLREAFYKNERKKSKLILGLHSARLPDALLINERVLGLSYQLEQGAYKLSMNTGTVSKDFSRNGIFCTEAYMYDIIPEREFPLIGNKIGETNLAAINVEYDFQEAKNIKRNKNKSEGDEFSSGDDLIKKKLVQLNTFGLAVYKEFGSLIPNNDQQAGAFMNMDIAGITIRPVIMYQISDTNSGIMYQCKLNRVIFWKNSGMRTMLSGAFLGFYAVDENAIARNSFSNPLMGEVLRLDVPENPAFLIGVRHSFSKIKTHLKLQYTRQSGGAQYQEANIELGKKFFNRLYLNMIGSYLDGNEFEEDHYYMGRLEFRLYF